MLSSNNSLNQLQLSVSMIVSGVIVEKFAAALTQWLSLVKVPARIFMLLPIFVVSEVDAVFPAVATIPKRGG